MAERTRSRETTAETTTADSTVVAPVPKQVAYPNLNAGGTRRNKGGGRRPSILRAKALQGVDIGLACAFRIIRSKKARAADQINAAEFCASIGLGERIPRAEVRERLVATVATLRSLLPADQADDVVVGIGRHWEGL
jgi:hypothetical protein